MAFWNKQKIVNENSSIVNMDYTPSLSSDFLRLTEQFKGEIEQKKVKFPSELGEEHPIDFMQMQKLYEKFGLFTAVVDKYIDYIVGPGFYITCDNEKAKFIIEEFMRDVNLDTLLRTWLKEALPKGNGFLELGGSVDKGIEGMKVLNANYMYVNRDNKGKVLGYNQYKGAFDKFSRDKVIPFTPDQIAHFAFNVVGDCAYGMGMGASSLQDINNLLQQEKDKHQIINRKANSPLHAKLGKVDGNVKIIPKKEDVEAFGQKMETMDNRTEWATDDLVDLKVVDFGPVGDKFTESLNYDLEKLMFDWQMPMVLMGKANVSEGIARVDLEGFQRRIQSIQAEVEKIIEEKIFKRVLNANGLDVHVEFEWGTPSIMEVEGRLKLVTEMIKSPATGFALRELLEEELVNLLKLDKDEYEQLKVENEEARRREEERQQPIIPGQNQHFPQKPEPIVPTNQTKPIKKEMFKSGLLSKFLGIVEKSSQEKIEEITIVKKKEKKKEDKKEIKNEKKTKNYEYEKECKHCLESWNDVNDIEEWLGFKYKDYIKQILSNVKSYDFNQISAVTENERQAGYLSEEQIGELKAILEDGFKRGLSMRDMAKSVDSNLRLKDLYRMTEDGDIKKGAAGLPILQKSKDNRAISIVRSEVTRLANMGAVDYYKENGISKVRWLASFGDRTCPDCEALNGEIFDIGQEEEMPLHPMCRCAYVPVVEVK